VKWSFNLADHRLSSRAQPNANYTQRNTPSANKYRECPGLRKWGENLPSNPPRVLLASRALFPHTWTRLITDNHFPRSRSLVTWPRKPWACGPRGPASGPGHRAPQNRVEKNSPLLLGDKREAAKRAGGGMSSRFLLRSSGTLTHQLGSDSQGRPEYLSETPEGVGPPSKWAAPAAANRRPSHLHGN